MNPPIIIQYKYPKLLSQAIWKLWGLVQKTAHCPLSLSLSVFVVSKTLGTFMQSVLVGLSYSASKHFKQIKKNDIPHPVPLPYPLYSNWMNKLINKRGFIGKLNWWQIFPCQYIHVYSLSINIFILFLHRVCIKLFD